MRYDAGTDLAPLRRAWDQLCGSSGSAWRISVRQVVPHLEVHCLFPSLATRDARELLGVVTALAEAVAAPR
jgi:hypothetical protein